MHVAGKAKIQSGYVDAQSRAAHHGGSFDHHPAQAWARLGERIFVLDAQDGIEPHQLVQKCEAMLRNGAGWRVAKSPF